VCSQKCWGAFFSPQNREKRDLFCLTTAYYKNSTKNWSMNLLVTLKITKVTLCGPQPKWSLMPRFPGDPDFCDFEAYVAENSSKVPGTRSLQCHLCQKVTIHIGNMKQHFEVHHYHRSYKCNICQRNFKTKNSLDVHKKTQGHYQTYPQ